MRVAIGRLYRHRTSFLVGLVVENGTAVHWEAFSTCNGWQCGTQITVRVLMVAKRCGWTPVLLLGDRLRIIL